MRKIADLERITIDWKCDNYATLVEFGKELGVTLTLEEGVAVAEYMMGCREESLGWIKTDIPVFAVRP